jgi:hypothetical protein
MSYELISDLFKDATGSRPDAAFFNAFQAQTEAEKAVQWNYLCDMLTAREADDRVCEAEALMVLNNRLAGMMADYDIDMATAMRWDMETFEIVALSDMPQGQREQEIEYYLFNQGIAINKWPFYVTLQQ